MAPTLIRLREETHHLHRLIETNPLHQSIVEGTVTPELYGRLLQKMHRVHVCYEPVANVRTEWAQFNFDFGACCRLRLLERDLQAVGVADPPAAPVPDPLFPLEGATFPFLLGYFYVLEGSALGGQILCRLIEQHLGLTPERGASYFYGAGPGTGARWRACQRLLSDVGDGFGDEAIVAGACDAFARLDAWLREE